VKRETAVLAANILQNLDEVKLQQIRLSGLLAQQTTPEGYKKLCELADWALGRLELNLSMQIEKL
jgi:hypothetical protein